MRQFRFFQTPRSQFLSAIAGFVMAILLPLAYPAALQSQPAASPVPQPSSLEQALSKLPPLLSHPLPPPLMQQPANQAGDYFDQVQPTIVGALVWSSFPITVYIQPRTEADGANPFLSKRAQDWVTAVQQAVQEWQPFLPIKIVDQSSEANISIWRSTPPLRIDAPQNSAGDRRLPSPRARSAETRYEFYARATAASDKASVLAHRMTIYIRPDQAIDYLQAAARHELGHALGIWGHSPVQTDALYFSQVRHPAKISLRDINTLRRVYEQPTRLGWEMGKKVEVPPITIQS